MPFLQLLNLSYSHPQQKQGLQHIHLELAKGEFHCLLGRSGCGKSTLLKLAAGLLTPKTGQVLLEGAPLTQPEKQIGFVFQNPTLLDWLTVWDNILLPASLHARPSPLILEHAQQLLQDLGLNDLMHHYPPQLSGGQQSRVAIARALLLQPPLLLMDEPFAALDALTREQLQDNLLHTCSQHQSTVLFVTHDVHEAIYLADRLSVIEQGHIQHQQKIPLPKPRYDALRSSAPFTELAQHLRGLIKQLL